MKKFVACLVVLACVAPSAMAAQVSFSGVGGGPIVINEGEGAQLGVEVWLDSALDGAPLESLDLRMGSDTVPMIEWTWGASADGALFTLPGAVTDTPWPNTMAGMGWFFSGPPFGIDGPSAPFMLGTLTVDASGLVAGDTGSTDYFLYVGDLNTRGGDTGGDPDGRDGDFSKVAIGANSDILRGTGVITVVPEPATLALLGLGAIGFIARRKKA